MRIGIITFHRAYNCGAMLQAWALKTTLERMGHQVAFPIGDYNKVVPLWPPRTPLHDRCRCGSFARRCRSLVYRSFLTVIGKRTGITAGVFYDTFRRKYLPEIECEVADFGKNFDAIIVGSDQVLNPNIRGWTPYFLCRGTPQNLRKIAYAASIGEKPLSAEVEADILSALSSFSAVSVREPFKGFPVMVDPTLLLKADDYNAIAATSVHRREYVYLYTLEASEFEVTTARTIADRLGLDLLITPTWGTFHRGNCHGMTNKISPSFFVNYVKHAKYVLAGSFHGTALAVLHGKPFLNVIPDHRTTKRVSAMLVKIGEGDRVVNPDNDIDEMIVRLKRPLRESCWQQLEQERQRSLDWLQKAIEGTLS